MARLPGQSGRSCLVLRPRRARTIPALAVPADARVLKYPEHGGVLAQIVVRQLGLRAEQHLDAETGTRLVAAGCIRTGADDDVLVDLAHRAVAAVDADAERAAHHVGVDHAHRHLGHRDAGGLRPADAV